MKRNPAVEASLAAERHPVGLRRREFIGALANVAAARSLLAAAGANRARIGLCTFSCHQHWKAVTDGFAEVKFKDAASFYRYARDLGAEGMQTGLRSRDPAIARQIRELVESSHGYYEADLRLPKVAGEVEAFEADVRLARAAGARVARAVFTGGRRYELFKSLEEFRRFHAGTVRSLELVEPVLRRHQLKLAVENHKDLTAEELISLLRKLGSEWVGVLVDTGNNIALAEEPHAVVEALAPFALSVHFKDMAVQPHTDGFLLSEVRLGTGMLDLRRVVATLSRANPEIVFNLEMATRGPLKVPCLTEAYWATFPERKATHLEGALARVKANPLREPPPQVAGKTVAQILRDEEASNRHGLAWIQQHFRA